MSRQAQVVEAIERALLELNYASADLRRTTWTSDDGAPARELSALRAKMAAAGRAIESAFALLDSDQRRMTSVGAARYEALSPGGA